MRLGIFGGTFDPVHYGHLVLAEQCRELCQLDAVRFLPSGSPPHKQDTSITPAKCRIEMLELAIAGHPNFSVDAMELEREGPTYTVDTLRTLNNRAEAPDQELFFLIGGDSLAEFVTWREPGQIVELATIVAVNRGGEPMPDVAAVGKQLGESVADRIQIVEIPGIDISSTDLRERVRTGRSIRYMTPRAVELFIEQQKLYRDAP